MNASVKDKLNFLINKYDKYYALIYVYLIFALSCIILRDVISVSDKFIENYIVIPIAIGFWLFISPWLTSLGICMVRHTQGKGNIGNWLGIFLKVVLWEVGFLIYPFWYCFERKKIHIWFLKLYHELSAKKFSKSFVSKKKEINKKDG